MPIAVDHCLFIAPFSEEFEFHINRIWFVHEVTHRFEAVRKALENDANSFRAVVDADPVPIETVRGRQCCSGTCEAIENKIAFVRRRFNNLLE